MHPLKFLTLLLPSVYTVSCLSTLTYEPFEVLTSAPFPWEELPGASVPVETKITLQMPLVYHDQDAYKQRILASHDPTSPEYRKTIEHEELVHLLAPTDETYKTVMSWLSLYGIPEADINLEYDWLSFDTTVGKAEALLMAEYRLYVNHYNGDQVTLRCLGYSLPREVKGMIRFVQPTTLFITRVGEREEERGKRGEREVWEEEAEAEEKSRNFDDWF